MASVGDFRQSHLRSNARLISKHASSRSSLHRRDFWESHTYYYAKCMSNITNVQSSRIPSIRTMHGSETCPSPEAAHDQDAKVNGGSQEAEYAFLVHSRESLSQGSSPSIDNQRLVRQKRRRTRYITTVNKQTRDSHCSPSPQDHAYLEAAYDRNPKPDKAARQHIVKHVALGEKEVQVRFFVPRMQVPCWCYPAENVR